MLAIEKQWRSAELYNLGFGVLGVVLIALDGLIQDRFGFEMARSIGIGLLSASVGLYFVLYRKPKSKPDAAEKERVVQAEQRSYKWLLGCVGVIVLCCGVIFMVPVDSWVFVASVVVMMMTLPVLLLACYAGLQTARLSRVDPSLFDERAQQRQHFAQSKAFTWMFTAAILGGALAVLTDSNIPVWLAFYGPAVLGGVIYFWYMWREDSGN